jgi:hypothetical protein
VRRKTGAAARLEKEPAESLAQTAEDGHGRSVEKLDVRNAVVFASS